MSSPAIRFAGFTDDWEERKIQDLADRHDNLRIPITASNRVSGNTPYYGANGIQDYVEGFTHDGEFILVAEDGANDLQDYPVNYVNFKVWVNNHAHVLQAKQFQADNKFLMNALKHTDIEPYLVGGGRAKLNAGTMMEISFPIPTVAEQSRIGKFFFALDDRITLHQRAHDKTVNIKKALLEKMFPKDGEDKPEIRFAGFTGAWEQQEAVNIFKTTADKGYPELPVLAATQDRGMILREDTGINIAHDKKNEATYKRVIPGQFVIHLRSFQGGFAHSNVEGITSPAYTVLEFNEAEKHYDWFWKYIFNSKSFVKRLETVTYGIRDGRSISYDDFSEMVFKYPYFDEQKRIAEVFVTFDRLIALHKRELTKLQNIKKALLEKMFV